ncbi:UDP-N-acetylmuramate dehydrogenase [Candidatus Acetothermia bacterium]|nr:UDP-N-acetylmuramate dehydrogenase [Candidatus Acetothermia bacterium]MCI2427702.1 UDP-N-acetylmuramate dehydrogenase [Candidatus Acetothermia bacterium]MCI2429018.1 UDP-N-acetylmuramate dehydrogenase [Candidatus Acetothermia bacterium]
MREDKRLSAELWEEFRSLVTGEVFLHAEMARHTTMQTGGAAACLFYPQHTTDIKQALAFCARHRQRYFVLGNGSNLLFLDSGYSGLVIATSQLRGLQFEKDGLTAWAGETINSLLDAANTFGYHELNFLAGIPGTVGGAVVMNAGIPQASISDVVSEVAVLDRSGRVRVLSQSDCSFSYRHSRIRDDGLIVIWVRFNLTNKQRYDRRLLLAQRAIKQPLTYPSAGCVFVNPVGFSAGELIEKANLKGFTVGKATVSTKHANFILNLGGAKSTDILKVIDITQKKVYKKFKIKLKLEIEIVGD